MAKEKVITVMCAARLPELLVKRVDAAAASGGVSRAQFIAEACRMRLDGPIAGRLVSVGKVQPPDNLPPLPYHQVESTDYPGLERRELPIGKADLEALVSSIKNKRFTPSPEILDLPEPIIPSPTCSECDNPMREVKGKWACVDQSCSMYGREQKVR